MLFYYVIHHIISDGWSKAVFIRELFQLYNSYVNKQGNQLQALPIQYKDYSVWQQKELESDLMNEHREFWLGELAGEIPLIDLPSEKLRPPFKTYSGDVFQMKLHAVDVAALKKVCRENGATLFMALLAAVDILIYRYTGISDIVIGTPVTGRGHVDLENQIGFYANTLALRTRINGSNNFAQVLQYTRNITSKCFDYQLYPLISL